jgi:hypothetical protein
MWVLHLKEFIGARVVGFSDFFQADLAILTGLEL